MSRDSSRTYIHFLKPGHAHIFEEFCRIKLSPDEIYVPPQHQPINPEDEDDVVPDQHAAFGIQRATQTKREPAWRDLGLEYLFKSAPEQNVSADIGLALRRKRMQTGLR
ncbi:Apc13 domain protein [Aulographum hederae CBS 113979]|uniref:Apc13 domain protein n=1 Tax=Aulographum hederae CBS 113979 TaxID=1176131 RepID=A0A6G1GNN2_9PEZI|nr:Apc13 domain protein [Aulographum hederae CBS 113979]